MANDLVVLKIDKCTAMLKECNTLQKARQIAGLAEAARVYSKRVGAGIEMTNEATAVRVKAERRFGEIMARLPKAKPPAGPGRGKLGVKKTPSFTDTPTLASLGVGKNAAKRCRKLAKIPERNIEIAAQEAVEDGKEISPDKLIKLVTGEVKKAKQEGDRKEAAKNNKDMDRRILIGKFQDEGSKIANGSVSLILTDPPYDWKMGSELEELAKFAKDKLMTGGAILCYIGQTQFPFAMDAFRKYLRYWWTIACLHEGDANLMKEYGIRVTWKPIMMFVKENRHNIDRIFFDRISGGQEKAEHPWQQAEAEAVYLIENLCPENGLIVDPCLGSGTTAAAAEKLHRKWIGIESDKITAIKAHKRIFG